MAHSAEIEKMIREAKELCFSKTASREIASVKAMVLKRKRTTVDKGLIEFSPRQLKEQAEQQARLISVGKNMIKDNK